MLLGEIVTLDVALLLNAIVTSAGGACDRVTASVAVCPSPTGCVAGKLIAPAFCTVTFVLAFAMFDAVAVAVIVVLPNATAVTGTSTVVAPAAIVTLAGTVATLGLLESKLTTGPPAGVGADR